MSLPHASRVLALNEHAAALCDAGSLEDALSAAAEAAALGRAANGLDLAVALNTMRLALTALGRDPEALPITLEFVELVRDRPSLRAAGLADLALLYARLDQPAAADHPTAEALAIRRTLGEPDALVEALTHRFAALLRLRRLDEAAEVSTELVALLRRRADPRLGGALTDLGGVLHDLGHDDAALPVAHESVDLLRRLDSPDLPTALNLLRDVHHALGHDALPIAEEAVAAHRRLDSPDLLRFATALNNAAMEYLTLGRFDDALPTSAEAVAVYRELADPARLALGLWTFAEVREAAARDLEAALSAIEESTALYESARPPGFASDALGTRALESRIREALNR